MSKWKEYKIGEISTYVNRGISPLYVEKNGITILNQKCIRNGKIDFSLSKLTRPQKSYTLEKKLANEDILINSTGVGTAGRVALFKNRNIAYVDTHVSIVRLNQKIAYPKFVFYNLFRREDEIEGYAEGSTGQIELGREKIKDIDLLLPALNEQKVIASILISLDDKIDLLHRQNETLEKMAETLFRLYFIESNDVHKDFVNRTFATWISETVGGEWGKEVPESEYTKAVNCIRGTDIADLNTGLPNKIPVRYVKDKKFTAIEPKEGDLIIEISGGTESQSTGRICYINEHVKTLFNYPIVFSNFCRLLRIKKPEYSFFVYCYIHYLYSQDEFFNLENGSSGIKNLDYKALIFELEYRMPASDKLILKFHEDVSPLFSKINQNKSQICSLTTLRDTLLPKLMSGEVKVTMRG